MGNTAVDPDEDPSIRDPTRDDGVDRINHLEDYSIELSAKGVSVARGKIEWDAVKDLTCDSGMAAAADQVDVCSLFEDEVDRAIEAGWAGGSEYMANFAEDITTPDAGVGGDATLTWEIESRGKTLQFHAIWYANDGDDGADAVDLYADSDDPMDATGGEGDPAVRDGLIVQLLDQDGDPMVGDIGKIDRRRIGTDGEMKNARPDADGKADNDSDGNAACSDDDGGDGCDAEQFIDVELAFEFGTAFKCEAERTVQVECTWNAQGRMGLTGNVTDDTPLPTECAATGALSGFLSRKVMTPQLERAVRRGIGRVAGRSLGVFGPRGFRQLRPGGSGVVRLAG